MRKMKKVLSLAMTAAMTASLLTGMGAVTASAKKSDDGKRTKITALLRVQSLQNSIRHLIIFLKISVMKKVWIMKLNL